LVAEQDILHNAARSAGIASVSYIILTIVCIWAAWWALQGFRLDLFMRQPKGMQAKLLMIMLSIVIGYSVAKFIIDYMAWSMLLKWLL